MPFALLCPLEALRARLLELEHAAEQQRLELEKTLLSMKATAQESSVHGKEALALAKAAEGKASTAMR